MCVKIACIIMPLAKTVMPFCKILNMQRERYCCTKRYALGFQNKNTKNVAKAVK